MRIYFLTREPDVCQLLADKFSDNQTEIKIFPIATKLLQNVFDYGIEPDILLLDFLYYQAEFFNLYELLIKHEKMFPIVFYNHPFPIPEKRKFFWLYNLQRTGYFSDLSKIEPILDKLQKALQDPHIMPYVSAIQNPKPYRSTNMRYIEALNENEIEYYTQHFSNVITDFLQKEKQPDSLQNKPYTTEKDDLQFIAEFRNRNKLSHKIYVLFSYLYKKRNTHIPVSELCSALSKGSRKIEAATTNCLRLAVYRLREILHKDTSSKMEVISFDHGYMLIDDFCKSL